MEKTELVLHRITPVTGTWGRPRLQGWVGNTKAIKNSHILHPALGLFFPLLKLLPLRPQSLEWTLSCCLCGVILLPLTTVLTRPYGYRTQHRTRPGLGAQCSMRVCGRNKWMNEWEQERKPSFIIPGYLHIMFCRLNRYLKLLSMWNRDAMKLKMVKKC